MDTCSYSIIGITINFVNTALGGSLGLMGNIYSVSKLGIFWFIIGSFISMILTFFSIQFLCISAESYKSCSTHNLSKVTFGKKGSLLTKFFVAFGNWTFIVNIIQIFADVAPQIINNWSDLSSNSFLSSRSFSVIIALIIIFPWILVKKISSLEKLSILCLIFAIFIFIILTINGIKCINNNSINKNIIYFVTNPYDIFMGLPTISWCWSLQFNAIPIYLSINPQQNRLNQLKYISIYTVFILFIFYAVQGIMVYLVWAESINNDFITNLDYKSNDYIFYFNHWLSTLTQFIISICCFLSIPIFAYECRTNLHSIIINLFKYNQTSAYIVINQDIQQQPQQQQHIIETTCSRLIQGLLIVISAALVALLITDLNLCLQIAGSTYSVYISYFLPSGIYLIYYNQQEKINQQSISSYNILLKYIAIFSIIYGVIVCIAGLITSFM